MGYFMGSDSTPGITGVLVRPGAQASIYQRLGDGRLEQRDIPWQPFFIIRDPRDLDHAQIARSSYRVQELEGPGAFRYQIFPGKNYWAIAQALKAGEDRAIRLSLDEQFLIQSGMNVMRGVTLGQIRVAYLDLETGGLNPLKEQILLAGVLAPDGSYHPFHHPTNDERCIIRSVVDFVEALNVDVIAGFNVEDFDLQFLAKRAELHRIPLPLGRMGASLRQFSARLKVADRKMSYQAARVPGRGVVDGLLLAHRYNGVQRLTLPSNTLKEWARALGKAPAGRIYIPGSKIPEVWNKDRDRVLAYNHHDLIEAKGVVELLAAPYVALSQGVPALLDTIITAGPSRLIDLLMTRAYVTAGKAIPAPQPKTGTYEGAATNLHVLGLVRPVAKLDVVSLYPSVMLAEHISPPQDTEGAFLGLLSEVRDLRLHHKGQVKLAAPGSHEEIYHDAFQQALKVLANSFYGVLGSGFSHFNGPAQAARVTERGREVLEIMSTQLESRGAQLVEEDTDGILFRPPPGLGTPDGLRQLASEIEPALGPGLHLEAEGPWLAIYAGGVKNYAIHKGGATILLRGSSFKGAANEPVFRAFMQDGLRHVLSGDAVGFRRCFFDLAQRLRAGEVPIDQLATSFTLSRSTDEYLRDRKRAQPEFDALIAKGRAGRAGDRVETYVSAAGRRLAEDHTGDESRDYYVERLLKVASRLVKAFSAADARLMLSLEPVPEEIVARVTLGSWPAAQRDQQGRAWYVKITTGIKDNAAQPHVVLPADDDLAIRTAFEATGNRDCYRSAFRVLAAKPPSPKGGFGRLVKSGDLVIELEKEPAEPERPLAASRRVAAVLEEDFGIPSAMLERIYGGGGSIYISVPQMVLGLPDSADLHQLYKEVALRVGERAGVAIDEHLYDAGRVLREVGTWYPGGGGRCIRMTVDEHRTLPVAQLHQLSLQVERPLLGRPADAFTVAKARRKTEEIVGKLKKSPAPAAQRAFGGKRLENRLKLGLRTRDEGKNILEAFPCLRNIAEMILRGGRGLGWDGRRKFILEAHQLGVDEDAVVKLFLDSPRRDEFLKERLIVVDTRADGNASGYRIDPRYDKEMPIGCDESWSWCDPDRCPLQVERNRQRSESPSEKMGPDRPPGWTFQRMQQAAGEAIDEFLSAWAEVKPAPPGARPKAGAASVAVILRGLEKAFAALAIEPTADGDTVKSAFRRAARIHHPDHGGDTSTMVTVSTAYQAIIARLTGK